MSLPSPPSSSPTPVMPSPAPSPSPAPRHSPRVTPRPPRTKSLPRPPSGAKQLPKRKRKRPPPALSVTSVFTLPRLPTTARDIWTWPVLSWYVGKVGSADEQLAADHAFLDAMRCASASADTPLPPHYRLRWLEDDAAALVEGHECAAPLPEPVLVLPYARIKDNTACARLLPPMLGEDEPITSAKRSSSREVSRPRKRSRASAVTNHLQISRNTIIKSEEALNLESPATLDVSQQQAIPSKSPRSKGVKENILNAHIRPGKHTRGDNDVFSHPTEGTIPHKSSYVPLDLDALTHAPATIPDLPENNKCVGRSKKPDVRLSGIQGTENTSSEASRSIASKKPLAMLSRENVVLNTRQSFEFETANKLRLQTESPGCLSTSPSPRECDSTKLASVPTVVGDAVEFCNEKHQQVQLQFVAPSEPHLMATVIYHLPLPSSSEQDDERLNKGEPAEETCDADINVPDDFVVDGFRLDFRNPDADFAHNFADVTEVDELRLATLELADFLRSLNDGSRPLRHHVQSRVREQMELQEQVVSEKTEEEYILTRLRAIRNEKKRPKASAPTIGRSSERRRSTLRTSESDAHAPVSRRRRNVRPTRKIILEQDDDEEDTDSKQTNLLQCSPAPDSPHREMTSPITDPKNCYESPCGIFPADQNEKERLERLPSPVSPIQSATITRLPGS